MDVEQLPPALCGAAHSIASIILSQFCAALLEHLALIMSYFRKPYFKRGSLQWRSATADTQQCYPSHSSLWGLACLLPSWPSLLGWALVGAGTSWGFSFKQRKIRFSLRSAMELRGFIAWSLFLWVFGLLACFPMLSQEKVVLLHTGALSRGLAFAWAAFAGEPISVPN